MRRNRIKVKLRSIIGNRGIEVFLMNLEFSWGENMNIYYC